jgi:predicted nucleic acid-binding protein
MAASPERPVAVLDANVLYPQFLRDVMLRLAAAELFTPRWTDRIHREWTRNVAKDRPDIPPDRLARVRSLMEEAFPEARVQGYRAYERLFAEVDPKDRHVAAAALKGGATVIVTRNLRDFPSDALSAHGLSAADPDRFILQLVARDRATVDMVLERHRAALTRPPYSPSDYRAAFIAAGLIRSANRLFP